jgi:formylglycine-generating enzyme required for sulfatase activity
MERRAGRAWLLVMAALPGCIHGEVRYRRDAGTDMVETSATGDRGSDLSPEATADRPQDTTCAAGACLAQRSCVDPTGPGCGLVEVAGGSFTMGEGVAPALTAPTHPVTLGGFAIDAYEVSVGRFRRYWELGHPAPTTGVAYPGNVTLSWSGTVFPPGTDADCTWSASAGSREEHPVNCVDWYTAQAFCVWDGGRLPTEAEWEYAARGRQVGMLPVPRAFPWGDTPPSAGCDRAHWNTTSPRCTGMCPGEDGVGTRRVTRLAASEGIFNQAGNVSEWAADSWTHGYYETTCWGPMARVDPLCILDPPSLRIVRGGGWQTCYTSGAPYLRAASRGGLAPTVSDANVGFRCARSR